MVLHCETLNTKEPEDLDRVDRLYKFQQRRHLTCGHNNIGLGLCKDQVLYGGHVGRERVEPLRSSKVVLELP